MVKKLNTDDEIWSEGERIFWTRWVGLKDFQEIPGKYLDPVREYKFWAARGWRFDFAWPEHKVAVEIEGGVFTQGRHTRPIGFQEDCEKYNRAAENGWRVLRYTPQMIEADPLEVITQIKCLLNGVIRIPITRSKKSK